MPRDITSVIPGGTDPWLVRSSGKANSAFARILTTIGVATARPAAILVVPAYGVWWAYVEPKTFDWHAIAVLCAWGMTFFIQRAAHRDTQAIHAKLDELLKCNPAVGSEVEHIDEREPEEIERHRESRQP